MTEEEAKNKLCCGPNVLIPDRPTNMCMGSDCMAWRKLPDTKCVDMRGRISDRDIDGTGRWIKEGYCGLAGAL